MENIDESHYKKYSIEPKDVIDDWGLGFNLGNVIKYIGRLKHNNKPLEDLQKAINYLEYEKEKYRKDIKDGYIEYEEVQLNNKEIALFIEFCFIFGLEVNFNYLPLWFEYVYKGSDKECQK